MMKREDFLVEIHTEELPPKALLKLADAFSAQMKERLQKADLTFAEIISFATPRRLALLVKDLAGAQPDQTVERKGPAIKLRLMQQAIQRKLVLALRVHVV